MLTDDDMKAAAESAKFYEEYAPDHIRAYLAGLAAERERAHAIAANHECSADDPVCPCISRIADAILKGDA